MIIRFSPWWIRPVAQYGENTKRHLPVRPNYGIFCLSDKKRRTPAATGVPLELPKITAKCLAHLAEMHRYSTASGTALYATFQLHVQCTEKGGQCQVFYGLQRMLRPVFFLQKLKKRKVWRQPHFSIVVSGEIREKFFPGEVFPPFKRKKNSTYSTFYCIVPHPKRHVNYCRIGRNKNETVHYSSEKHV